MTTIKSNISIDIETPADGTCGPVSAIRLLLKDALADFLRERTCAGGTLAYVRDRYTGQTQAWQARKVLEVEARCEQARQLMRAIDDATITNKE